MSAAVYLYCITCLKPKKPIGRSAPMEMANGLCDYECPGYDEGPKPDCRWPGEYTCGSGCTRGDTKGERTDD